MFKAPTGSGKTIMAAEFLKQVSGDAHYDPDKAYVWISFNPDLVEQSYKKLTDYLDGGVAGLFDTSELSQRGKLNKNDVLFVNWQKIVQSERSRRNLRLRIDGEETISFDTFIAKTKADHREVVLIVDEGHMSRGTALAKKVIDQIDPRVIIEISATPSYIPTAEDMVASRASFVYVNPLDVINAGLIKESIMVMPREDVKREAGKGDIDEAVLDMAISKREEMARLYATQGASVNPLVLIKLPNDEQRDRDADGQNKLDFTKQYLSSRGIPDDKIAVWLDREKINLSTVEDNDNPVEYLIFKQAAATGWDCPRADVLVMFREIRNATFETQVLGRILRTAEAKHYDLSPSLNHGYLYTTYERSDVIAADKRSIGPNETRDALAMLRQDIENIQLPSVYFERPDYNDLGDSFQGTFASVADAAFGIKKTDTEEVFLKKLELAGFDISARSITNSLIVNANIEVFDDFINELKKTPEDFDTDASYNDVQKMHTILLWRELSLQQEDSRKYAPERSWSDLKSALNVWFRSHTKLETRYLYPMICNDLERGDDSVLRPVISKALGEYRDVRNQEVQAKAERSRRELVFTLESRYYPSTSEPLLIEGMETKRYALEPAYVSVDSDVETRFIAYLEKSGKKIDWWYKNGAGGRTDLAIEYEDSKGLAKLFYPDFIVRQGNRVGLFDTKSGVTAETARERAEALAKYVRKQGNKPYELWGGIVIEAAGSWRLNGKAKYNYNPRDLSGWDLLTF